MFVLSMLAELLSSKELRDLDLSKYFESLGSASAKLCFRGYIIDGAMRSPGSARDWSMRISSVILVELQRQACQRAALADSALEQLWIGDVSESAPKQELMDLIGELNKFLRSDLFIDNAWIKDFPESDSILSRLIMRRQSWK